MSKELYAGVDLHSNNGVYHIVNSDGIQVWHRRLSNSPEHVLASLMPYRDELVCVAIESTYNWYWLADCLQENGFTVELANPAAMHQYSGLKNTNDDSDAAFVAELRRLNILPQGWICPPAQRAVRDLLRRRLLLVNGRTQQFLSLQSMLVRQTGMRYSGAALDALSAEELKELLRYAELDLVARKQLELIAAFSAAIGELEAAALERCRPRWEYTLLISAPGIGKILAMTIMQEIGDISRFPSPGDLSSYVRAVKASRNSNNKQKGKNNVRNGNRYLGWAFIEAVNHAIRCCVPARVWYEKKVSKSLPVVGRKALASKWSKAVWYMLTEKKPFRVHRVFG